MFFIIGRKFSINYKCSQGLQGAQKTLVGNSLDLHRRTLPFDLMLQDDLP